MIELANFKLSDLTDMLVQKEQEMDKFDPAVSLSGPAWSALDSDGHCYACGGLYPVTPKMAIAWAFIGSDSGPYLRRLMTKMVDCMMQYVDRWPVIRAGADINFPQGRRMLALLGFKSMGQAVQLDGRCYEVFEWVSGYEH